MACQKLERTIFEKLPFEIVDQKENETATFSIMGKMVFVGPKRYVQPELYKKHGLGIYNFEARSDDVYLIGYMRSGTTLHCEMVWLIANDLDYEGAAKHFLDYRFPHIELCTSHLLQYEKMYADKNSTEEMKNVASKYLELDLEGLSQRKGRRLLKSHLPLSLMPPHMFEVGAKVIYCARNPRDVMVSMYKTADFFGIPKSEFRDIFEDYRKDLVWNCPYFEHVKEAWERRNDKNVLFLFYEDTIKDKRRTIRKIADFLGKKFTEDEIDGLEDYLSFDKFQNNKSVNCDHLVKIGVAKGKEKFIRKGKSGGWKECFDEEMIREFNQWMEKNLRGTDLKFPE